MIRNLDDGKQTDVRIMEFSKAFDKVSHNFLTHKLKHYGIRGKVNNWIESFLSGRTQAVIVEGVKSTADISLFTIIQISSHVVYEPYKLSFARSKFAKAMLEGV
jgi:hypothetical protein